MAKWLLKSEPADYSIDDLAQDQVTSWGGIRNFQARNFIRDQMVIGDQVLIYHSSCKLNGVVGIAKVSSAPYADPEQFDQSSKYYDSGAEQADPKWYVVDIQFESKAKRLLPLKSMKQAAELADFILFKQTRLSVLPVSEQQWQFITSQLA